MRTELMLGNTFSRLQDAFVVVVGLGAVGSYAVEGLARSGVGRLRLVDFDCVGVTNINRQLYALSSTVGRKKCEVARERVADINPAYK
jgi:tRNA A37 threonylcarbamoyladenosine dehydratase